ncbi:MAG: elongation factor Ts [Patescibacteria group bacterium]|nr:elongation factor Ts [Patescibacteria group bacterium]
MDIETIKKLREQTGAGVMDASKALEEAGGNYDKAVEILKAKGVEKAAKKSDREIKAGKVFSYVHSGRVGALLKLGCETDFVAKNDAFVSLGNDIVMQIVSMGPENIEELLEQDFVKDTSRKIKDLISDTVSKTGENITIVEFNHLSV